MNTIEQRHDELEAGRPGEMAQLIADHPFVDGFDAQHIAGLAEISGLVEVPAGQVVFRRNEPAQVFYLITDGDVALEIEQPGQGPLVLETLHAGDALGWSWLFPPRRWFLDAHVTSDLTAVAVDAEQLRAVLDDDPEFGRDVILRVASLVVDRLQHARSQLASVRVR